MAKITSSSDGTAESDISDIGDILILWDQFNNIRDIARQTNWPIEKVNEAIKAREKQRIEREFRNHAR